MIVIEFNTIRKNKILVLSSNIHQRNRINNVPAGWTPMKDKKKRVVWRCPYYHKNYFTGEWSRCSYTCRKKQTTEKHEHRFDIPPNKDPGFDASHIKKEKVTYQDQLSDKIHQAVAHFIGSSSISSSVASSEEMKRFIITLFNISNNMNRPNIALHLEETLTINQKNIRDFIISEGNKTFDSITKKLSSFKFVNLSIDAATVLNMKVVHSTISNPYSNISPLPFRATQKDETDWGIVEYKEEIMTALTQIESCGLIPISICHDRLPAQSSAIRELLNDSENECYSRIVDVPCINHILNNVFVKTLRNTNELRLLVSEIEDLCRRLRTTEAIIYLGKKCKFPPKTRWLYIHDSLEFLILHREKIESYYVNDYIDHYEEDDCIYKNSKAIPDSFIELYKLLTPIKLASLAIECENSRLSDIVPLFYEIFKTYKEMLKTIQPGMKNILHNFISYLKSMIKILFPDEVWASWVLTTNGRHYIRKMNKNGFGSQYKEDILKTNSVANDFVKDFKYKMKIIDSDFSSDEEEWAQSENEEEETESEEIDQSMEESMEIQETIDIDSGFEYPFEHNIRSKHEKYYRKNLEELLGYDIRKKAYEKTIDVLKKYIDPSEEECLPKRYLDYWLFARDEPLEAIQLKQRWNLSTLEMWKHLALIEKYHSFAEVAMRLLSIGTSESSVERLISMHRYLVHDRMTNISPETLLARLRLRSMRNDEKKHETFDNPYWKL